MQPRWRQQTDNGRLVFAEGSSRGQRNFSFCFGFMVRWCIFQREAVYVYSLEDIDFFPFFPSSFSFLNRGQFPTVHSLLCTHSLFFIHLTLHSSDNTLLYYHLPTRSSIPSTTTRGRLDSSTLSLSPLEN